MPSWRSALGASLAVTVACKGSTPPPPPISVTFKNFLSVPVGLSIATTPYGILGDSAGTTIAFPGGTTTVTWTPGGGLFNGTPIAGDLNPTNILVADLATVEITNHVGSVVYFIPFVANSTGEPIMIGLAEGASLRCITRLDTDEGAELRYFVFDATTQIRTYRDGSHCTGPYQHWDYAAVQGSVDAKSGFVALEATIPP
jgi:hypothetical protein